MSQWILAALPGLFGVVVQLAALAWYGGRMAARLEHLEDRLDRLERRLDQLFEPLHARTSSARTSSAAA